MTAETPTLPAPAAGLLIEDRVIEFAGCERIRRDSRAWWPAGHYSTEPRGGDISVLCWHWTGGEAGLRSYDDDAPRVVAAMQARKSSADPTKPLRVSVQFVIGACDEDPDADALIWQTMDLGASTAIHVGDRVINRRSIGVEVVSCGFSGGETDTRKRPSRDVYIAGRRVKIARFYDGQMRAIAWLATVLSSADDVDSDLATALRRARISIPRLVPQRRGQLLSQRFTQREARTWRGAMEHLHSPSTTKIDAGLQGLEACRDLAEWAAVEM